MTEHPLHTKALSLSKTYLQTERELIKVLQEIERSDLFKTMGYTSLYDYCLKGLSLSEHQSNAFVTVSRKCTAVPELQQAIDSGILTVSKATRILPVMDSQACDWIEKASVLSQREIQREVARTFPDKAVLENIRPVSATKAELRCGITYEMEDKLQRVRQVLSTKRGRPVSLEESIEAMADLFLNKFDPIEKAKRREEHLPPSREVKPSSNPRNIPAAVQHQIALRDRGQCTAKQPDGRRCNNRAFLHLHHIKPVALGGQSVLDNLTTLCSAHHRMLHEPERLEVGRRAL